MTLAPAPSWVRDWTLLALLAAGSLATGFVGNLLRADRLPLVYRDQAARLEASSPRADPMAEPKPAHALTDLTLSEFVAYTQTKRPLILDARQAVFHRLGHVPGALSLPRADFGPSYAKLKDRLEAQRNELIVVYCSDESCQDSHLVQQALLRLGYAQVGVFTGGWSEWQDAGLAKEVSPP